MKTDSIAPIIYDYSSLIVPNTASPSVRQMALGQGDLRWLAPRLTAVRQEVIDDLVLFERFQNGAPLPEDKVPLDAAFFDLPERLLDEDRALLDDIIETGNRLAAEVDRVVVLGIGGSYMGARALFEACCHPYHNELSREARKGRPRVSFEGNNVDNDAVAGLLDVLRADSNWAIVVISKSGGTLETAAGFRIFLDALRQALGDDQEKLRRRIVPVTGETGRLRDLAQALGCPKIFPIHDGVGGRFSVLDPVALLPAAVLGLDVVTLLEGAAAMNERFRVERPGENPALDYAGIGRMMEVRRGATMRVLSTWGKRLEAVGLWYDQLLAESLGKDGQGPTPLTVVNTRDLHSRGQQHQEGRRDKLITNLYAEQTDREPIAIPAWNESLNQDKLNELAGKTLPDILSAARIGTNRAYAEDHRFTADIRLPRIDEASLGQLLQMLMVATVVEGRLVGINPYGQPGVEGYKKNMNAILRSGPG